MDKIDGRFLVKEYVFLSFKKNEKKNVYGVSVHSEGDEQVNRQRGPESRPSVPAGRGGGAAGPAAGGGVPAAGGPGAGAPGPRAGMEVHSSHIVEAWLGKF